MASIVGFRWYSARGPDQPVAPTGAVTALVDRRGALISDPLYDLVRFVGGTPADDPPAELHPGLHHNHFKLNPPDVGHAHA